MRGKEKGHRTTRDEIRGSRELLEKIFEFAPDTLFLFDLRGTFIDSSKAAERLTGYRREELIGKSFLKTNLLIKKDIPKAAAGLARNALGRPTGPDEYILNRKDGGQVTVEVAAYPIKIKGKTITLGIARDITERRRDENALKESEERLRDLFENTNDLIQSVNAEGRFVSVNRKWLEALGFTCEEVRNMTFTDILRRDQIPHCAKIFKQLRRGKSFEHVETVFLSKGGKDIQVEGNVSSHFKDGRFAATVGIFRDITERKKMERQIQERTDELNAKLKELEENRKAILSMMEDSEESNRQLKRVQDELKKAMQELRETDLKKDEFISITAHELKTPLTAIHGFAELLQSDRIDRKSGQKYLKIMADETKRLSKMVTEILDLSRIDIGTFKFSYEKTDLRKIIDDTRSEIRMPAERKGLKISYTIASDVPKTILLDPERLRQILINLLINAIKYTPEGSIELSVTKEKSGLRFAVKDTGIGIAKENIHKLFRRFYQIDSSYTRSVRGSGLGLALCKELVEGMGGSIWVDSRLGKGSTFHFTIPMRSEIRRQKHETIFK